MSDSDQLTQQIVVLKQLIEKEKLASQQVIREWMDMDGWMDGLDGWMDGWMDGWIDFGYGWMDGWMDRWVGGYGWMDGRTNRWMDGQMGKP